MREVWGENGVEQLWSAANVKTFGGGVDEEPFLRRLESLIGDYNRVDLQPVRLARRRRRGQPLDQLAAHADPDHVDRRPARARQGGELPTERRPRPRPTCRGIVFASGVPPVLVKPEYWWLGSHAADVRRSQELYDRPATPRPRRP